MRKNEKYPPIEPEFSKDKKKVCLNIDVYNSIFEEIANIKNKIKELKQKNKKSR